MLPAALALASAVPLTWNEALSGVFGSISLASWIVVLVPQFVENYTLQSAEGISLTFLLIWFVGDIANLIGALWAGLVPTVVALAVYFCFSDSVLVAQCLYYGYIKSGRKPAAAAAAAAAGTDGTTEDAEDEDRRTGSDHREDGEVEPLLGRRGSRKSNTSRRSENMGLPGSHRRSSDASREVSKRQRSEVAALGGAVVEAYGEESTARAWLKNVTSVLLICCVGAAGWTLAWKSGAWKPTPLTSDGGGDGEAADDDPAGAQVLGYASALCYLGARIPQIWKNHKDRSTEGLSLLFFMLSVLGNTTYGAGILFHSTEARYFRKNLPWLIGSLGTIAEDVIIFVQFRMYRKARFEDAIE